MKRFSIFKQPNRLRPLLASLLALLLPLGDFSWAQSAPGEASASPTTNVPPAPPAASASPASNSAGPGEPGVVSGNTPPPPAPDLTPPVDANAPANGRTKKVVGPPDTQARSAALQGPIVRAIDIQYIGPATVSNAIILSNMRTAVGQAYSAIAVEEDVRNLYATGFFTNLAIKDEPLGDGVKVNVVVQPKPLVKEIVVKGAKQIKMSRVRKEIKSKIGETLSEQQISTDADKVKELYLNRGYSQVQVSYKVDTNDDFGRSVVTFIIDEGPRAYVTEVDFVGNEHLTTKELRKILKTRKKNLLSFINKSGLYKEDDFRQDLDSLRTYYNSKGYIDMAVKDVKYVTPEKNRLIITISLFEGIQYHVGKIAFTGNKIFSDADFHNYKGFVTIRMSEGKIFSPRAWSPPDKPPKDELKELPTLENDIQRLRDIYGVRGYIDMQPVPERQANVESGKIDILYHITENSQSYIEQIIIQGNNRTKDKVLRRELANSPGQIYDSVLADQSKKRLENLQYFEKVDISPQDTTVPNRKNMVVTVEEKRTGSITFGAGFSSVDSLVGFVEISQGNFDLFNFPYFTGGGEKFRIRLQYGLERQDAEISLKEPWFLDQQLSFDTDLFFHNATYLSDYYNEENFGISFGVARAFGPFWSGSVSYTLQDYDLYNFASNSSSTLLEEQGYRTDSSITLSLGYDKRDSLLLTHSGLKGEITAQFAGGPLLGQTNIYKFEGNVQKYFPLPYDMILSISADAGGADFYGNSTRVPIFDRFFIGGSRSVRGFGNRDVGPVDNNNEPIGGDTVAYTNLELTFPIIDRVRGAIFNDIGYDDARAFHYTAGFSELDAAAGVGLRLNLPIGPLRLDYGIPYKDQGYNHSNTGKFSFDVGYQFR